MNVNTKARSHCDAAESCIKRALDASECGSLIAQHLERAKTHVNEAWIAADGQNARSVEQLLADLAEGERLRQFALTARKGDTLVAFGKVWRVNNEVAGPVHAVTSADETQRAITTP